ncbi:hypothetical protein J6590_069212 [Homalodisca vitripennis]|nr:hypothetical protein J6590_069212 [Homalodisca vitripennis]
MNSKADKPKTAVVRTSARQEDIYESLHHCIVAVSRHTNSFLYITPNSNDKLGQWIKQINLLSPHELSEFYINTETPNTQSNIEEPQIVLHTPFLERRSQPKERHKKSLEYTHHPHKNYNSNQDPKTTKHTLRSFTKTSIGCQVR